MLGKRICAMLCTAALILGLCGTGALADEAAAGKLPAKSVGITQPDPVGTVSFGNLAGRMRENCLNYLILEQNIDQIEVIDYDKMKEDLSESISELKRGRSALITASQMGDYYTAAYAFTGSVTYMQLDQACSSLQAIYDDLEDGKLQKDNNDLLRQLRNAQDQVLMAGEVIYIALAGLEITDSSLDRSLDALDRTVAEMELRHSLGQISLFTLQTAKNGRTSLLSSRETLGMNIRNLKLQLGQMIGEGTDGSIRLAALPRVTDGQLAGMDPKADLAAAEEASYSLYAAKQTLDDEKEAYDKRNRTGSYQTKQAESAWQAAQYTYQSAVQSFELGFQQLYSQVGDCRQALDAAQAALELERAEYALSRLNYDLGRISKNALLTAQDDVAAAQETVDSALVDLFSAYNTYRWAVDHGILN